MPDCPICGVEIAFGIVGGICPNCKKVYSPSQITRMPGYDVYEVMQISDTFKLLMSAGLLKAGVNEVEFFEDAVIIQNLSDPD